MLILWVGDHGSALRAREGWCEGTSEEGLESWSRTWDGGNSTDLMYGLAFQCLIASWPSRTNTQTLRIIISLGENLTVPDELEILDEVLTSIPGSQCSTVILLFRSEDRRRLVKSTMLMTTVSIYFSPSSFSMVWLALKTDHPHTTSKHSQR